MRSRDVKVGLDVWYHPCRRFGLRQRGVVSQLDPGFIFVTFPSGVSVVADAAELHPVCGKRIRGGGPCVLNHGHKGSHTMLKETGGPL